MSPEAADQLCSCGHLQSYHFADGSGRIACRATSLCKCSRPEALTSNQQIDPSVLWQWLVDLSSQVGPFDSHMLMAAANIVGDARVVGLCICDNCGGRVVVAASVPETPAKPASNWNPSRVRDGWDCWTCGAFVTHKQDAADVEKDCLKPGCRSAVKTTLPQEKP